MTDQAESPDVLAGLLDNYGTDVDTFEVVLPKGEILKFRQFRTYGELSRFNQDAAAFAVKATTKKSQFPEAWWPYLPDEREAAIAAYTLHALSVEPRFEQLHALRLLSAPWLVTHLMEQLNARRMNYLAQRFSEDVDEGKAVSGQTESIEPD